MYKESNNLFHRTVHLKKCKAVAEFLLYFPYMSGRESLEEFVPHDFWHSITSTEPVGGLRESLIKFHKSLKEGDITGAHEAQRVVVQVLQERRRDVSSLIAGPTHLSLVQWHSIWLVKSLLPPKPVKYPPGIGESSLSTLVSQERSIV